MTEDRLSTLINNINRTIAIELLNDENSRRSDFLLEVSSDIFYKIILDAGTIRSKRNEKETYFSICGIKAVLNYNLPENTYSLKKEILSGNYGEVEE